MSFQLWLNEKEQENLKAALKELGYGSDEALGDLEETFDGSKSYHFEVHPSNILDAIFVVYKGKKIDITDWESA